MNNNQTFSNREALKNILGVNDTFSNKVVLDKILTGPPLSNVNVRFLTATQAAFLDGKTFSADSYFAPTQDFYDQWFISTTEVTNKYPWIEEQPTGKYVRKCIVCSGDLGPIVYLNKFYTLGSNDTFSNDFALTRSLPNIYPYCLL